MLSSKIIEQIRQLELKAGHLVTDALAGEYVSVFRGMGMEFEKVREYDPTDDVRVLDWNVTARMNAPYVKVFKEERELTIFLIVDVSPSQIFGSTGRFKNEAAAELAAILAFLATKNNDKVGLILFSDHIEQFIPPKKGRSHIWRIIRQIFAHEAKGKRTELHGALEYFNKVCKRKSICFLLSDFYANNYEKALQLAAHRHDLVCIEIKDPNERVLPECGLIEVQDAETGEHVVLDMSDNAFRKNYQEQIIAEEKKRRDFFRRHKIDFFEVNTRDPVLGPLIKYIHMLARRLRK